jgi:energy-coupling factor transporter ATP-binding protein EcfA2
MTLQITRLRVENVRRFRAPVELRELEPGLNLFTGPNEAGKSTLVAAIRAAFFERNRSKAGEALLPWDAPSASPDIEIDFRIGDTVCRLHKRFMRANCCELQEGTTRLDADAAESRLAELLGFAYPGKGPSKPEHWGIPGLLWIEQGAGQEIGEAVGHATDYLRSALDRSMGEVASSHGDEVIEQVRRDRDALLTRKGDPREAYAEAIEASEAAKKRLDDLDEHIARYRDQVDALGRLRAEHLADTTERPWEGLRQAERQVREALSQIDRARAELDQRKRSLSDTERHFGLLENQLRLAEAQRNDLTRREAAVVEAEHALDDLQRGGGDPEAHVREHEARVVEAAQALETARALAVRVDLVAQQGEAARALDRIATALEGATEQHTRVQAAQTALATQQVDAKELSLLRAEASRLAELRIRQQAVATQVRFVLEPGARMRLAGEPLTGSGERLLTASARLDLPGLGAIEIVPGGDDLARLAADAAVLEASQRDRLQRLGVADLAAAETRAMAADDTGRALALAREMLKTFAPKGLEALRADHASAAERVRALAARVAALPAVPSAATSWSAGPTEQPAPAPDLITAQRQVEQALGLHQAALAALEQARAAVVTARLAMAGAQQTLTDAVRERDALRVLLADPKRLDDERQALDERERVGAAAIAQRAAVAAMEQTVAAAQPDRLRLDVDRFGRSAAQLEAAHADRQKDIIGLQAVLESVGAQGLEEERAEVAVQAEALERRRLELERRAAALDLLTRLLEAKRSERVRRLQAPLQQRVDHYLSLLFPGARLAMGEDLAPDSLVRAGSIEPPQKSFGALSFGAREQLALVSRLAYADLLRESGRPTLIILDDALVHADAQRLADMKRVLYDAAQRHQVLLFTCHPQSWRDAGAVARAIG